jgi:uncharacterized protein (DUF1810 family)
MDDVYQLQRFVDAQEPYYEQARAELAAGRKRTHWIWFIFPQIHGLGASAMSQRFAISGPAEAAAYLQHPILGPRLRDCTAVVNALSGKSIEEIFGYPDDLKFHSSMTLFAWTAEQQNLDSQVFAEALTRYFAGKRDEQTLKRLS